MNTPISIIFVILIVGAVTLDQVMGWGGTLFLLRKLSDFIEFTAFWR